MPMPPVARPTLLILTLLCVGCAGMMDSKRNQKEAEEKMLDDNDERKARLQAEGSLSPEAYQALALKMGWTTKGANGLPPPPTTEELEKRVRDAKSKP
jgi:hypothetical protein